MRTPEPAFLLLALLTLAAALGTVALRNMVHSALCLALTFIGIAMLFLQLGAEFVGLAQVLVYVGAVAILIVFAILLVRGGGAGGNPRLLGRSWSLGLATSLIALAAMLMAILNSPSLLRVPARETTLTVKAIGDELMSTYVLPLEVLGLLLTAAMMGAAIIALQEPSRAPVPAASSGGVSPPARTPGGTPSQPGGLKP